MFTQTIYKPAYTSTTHVVHKCYSEISTTPKTVNEQVISE